MNKLKISLIILGIIIALLLALMYIFFPPSKGNAKDPSNEGGNKTSISEKIFIEVDNEKLGMFIMGNDKTKPVLLVCGGGPGIPQYILESQFPSVLVEEFVVCYWDYRGTGLSYSGSVDSSKMTKNLYLSDVKSITEYLSKRFNQEKIYILGHSFGAFIALNAVKGNPQNYHAYFAMSQVCDQRQSEIIAYDYMREDYLKNNKDKMVKEFDNYPIENNEQAYLEYFRSGLRDKAMHELGIGTTRKMDSVISGIFLPSLKIKEYTQVERINIWKGKAASNDFVVTKEAGRFNVFSEIKSIDIPIYFFAGKYDYTCAYSLQKKYFEEIEAPIKEFYTFHESAHSPIYEEPEKARKIFRKIIEN